MEKVKFDLNKILKKCLKCNQYELEYWDKTDEELIYKCKQCQSYKSIPFNTDELSIYFSF